MAQTAYRQFVTCLNTNTNELFTHDVYGISLYTKCPGDIPYHTFQNAVNAGSFSQNEVFVKNLVTGTQGLWRCEGEAYDVPSGPSTSYVLVGTKTFGEATRLGCCNIIVNPLNSGDYVSGEILFPLSYTGNITSAVSSGNTITVTSTAITKIRKGMTIVLTDGATTQDLGKVTNVNIQTLTVTVTNTITNSFTTSATIQLEYMFIDAIKLVSGTTYSIGASINGSIYLPAGSILEIYYKNTTADAKTLDYYVEFFV